MAFISVGGVVVSFCDADDIRNRDVRVLEANEVSNFTDLIEDANGWGERATENILYEIKDTDWWKSYFIVMDQGATDISTQGLIDVPLPITNKFIGRQQDFTDLCVYKILYEYFLPYIADFSNQDNAEVKKIGVYREKYQSLFRTLINAGDWYDFDGLGTVSNTEKMPTRTNLIRVR